MGRDLFQLTVSASVSRHNSAQDRVDDEAFRKLHAEIEKLCAKPDYVTIRPSVQG